MTTEKSSNGRSFVYVGLAGETAPGRVVASGLYRMAQGDDGWELLENGLPEAPAIRAIAIHPERSSTVFVGTQDGPYRSEDHGDHWEKVNVPDHGLPVWSLLFHPRDPNVMFAGYESSEIYRSDDGGERWQQLPVSVRFPEVTVGPGANLAKRVLQIAGVPANTDELYGAIEVGGIIRTLDGGEHWEQLSHGQYVNDDPVDMHGVLASAFRPGTVLGIGRAGMFRSNDQGNFWSRVQLDPLNEKGQTYCRQIREVPGDPKTIWVAAGANFMSDLGVLFRSSGRRHELGPGRNRLPAQQHPVRPRLQRAPPQRHVLRLQQRPGLGQRRRRRDLDRPSLPEGARQVYSMACG